MENFIYEILTRNLKIIMRYCLSNEISGEVKKFLPEIDIIYIWVLENQQTRYLQAHWLHLIVSVIVWCKVVLPTLSIINHGILLQNNLHLSINLYCLCLYLNSNYTEHRNIKSLINLRSQSTYCSREVLKGVEILVL